MLAIYKKELKSYFHSFIGFLFVGATLFLLGLYFTVYNLFYSYPYYSYVVSSTSILFLISVPILCMRILAEERHNKTDQLILTAPISVGKIVMGKYLALVTIFAIPTLISCLYPVIMSAYGTVPMWNCYLAILAYFLYGITCIAVCIFLSSFTESQVIAAVLGFGVLFLGHMMSSICSLISTSGNLLTKILGAFDLYTPFAELLNGTLNLDAVIYYLSIVALALFLTVQSIQKRRYSISVKHMTAGAYSTGMIAVAVAMTVLVNTIVAQLPGSVTALDLSADKMYSLTDVTKNFLKELEQDVTIYVMTNDDYKDDVMTKTLERYQDASKHIKVENVDPSVNPRFHTQYTSESISWNSLIVVSGERSVVISADDMYEYTVDYETYTSSITGYDGEGQITSAISRVTVEELPKVYMTEGHGEYTLSTTFTGGLKQDNVETESINLMDVDSVPEDASCLLIFGPETDFNEDDVQKVLDYLGRGGNVIAVASDSGASLKNFEKIFAYMGLELAEGLVVEQNRGYYYNTPYYLLPDIIYSDYTVNVYGGYYVFAPYAKGIVITQGESEEYEYETFLETSDSAFSKKGLLEGSGTEKEDGDAEGPFGIGVKAVKDVVITNTFDMEDGTTESIDSMGTATMIAVGSREMFTDGTNEMVGGANQMVFNSIVKSFSEFEQSIYVPVKNYTVSYLMVSQQQAMLVGAIVTVVLPLGCFLTGFVIWYRRRKR